MNRYYRPWLPLFFLIIVALVANANSMRDLLSEDDGAMSVVATTTPENRRERVEALTRLLHIANADAEQIDGNVVENAIRVLGQIDASGSAVALLKQYAEGTKLSAQTRCLAVQAIAETTQRLHGSDVMIDVLRKYLESDSALVAQESRSIIASDRSSKAELALFDLLDKHYAMLPQPDFALTEANGHQVEALFIDVIADLQALKQLGTKNALAKLNESFEALRRQYPSGPGHKAVQYLEAEGILSSAQESSPILAETLPNPRSAIMTSSPVSALTPPAARVAEGSKAPTVEGRKVFSSRTTLVILVVLVIVGAITFWLRRKM